MSSPQVLRDQIALVTGATSGIGRATALALAEAGAHVCLNHFDRPKETEQVAGEIRDVGREALVYHADVSDLSAVEAMVEAVVDKWGRLDAAVTSAYFSKREPLCEADMEGFRRTVDVTLFGAVHTFRAAGRQMIAQGDGGALVAIGSPHAWLPFAGAMAYNASKAALVQVVRTLATELAENRIRVNIVHPGWTDTEGERKFYTDEQIQAAGAKTPWGRMAAPAEIARGVVFMCDPASDYVTGSGLLIDGGLTLPFWAKGGRLD